MKRKADPIYHLAVYTPAASVSAPEKYYMSDPPILTKHVWIVLHLKWARWSTIRNKKLVWKYRLAADVGGAQLRLAKRKANQFVKDMQGVIARVPDPERLRPVLDAYAEAMNQ